jgi:predicted ATPase
MAKSIDKPTTMRAQAIFAEWLERTGDHRVAADRAGVSERTGRRWRLRFLGPERQAPTAATGSGPPPAAAQPAPKAREPKTNMAFEATRFVGRQSALTELRNLFARGARVVTVLGPGGIGKTRLVTRYGDLHLFDYSREGRGGVWFCDLTEARTAEGIVGSVGHALGVPLTAGASLAASVEQLGHSLASRGLSLFILDNFEQATSHAAATVGRWLAMASKAQFLVTSREALALPGEVAWHVESLGLPEPHADAKTVAASEAVELFVDRARLVRPDYGVTEADAEVVGELVRQLDGIPLAIELAAARMAVLPPGQLLTRLRSRFELLAAGSGTPTTRPGAARRQASMRAAIDWSWNLLSPIEQAALRECSVFHGGFTLEAAEAILVVLDHAGGGAPGRGTEFDHAGGGAPGRAVPAQVLDVLQALRQRSLLRVHERPGDVDGHRLGMYESIRDYAREKLKESGTLNEVALRHATYYVELATGLASRIDLVGGQRDRALLARELDNLTAAWTWALSEPSPTKPRVELALRASLAAMPILSARGPRGADLVPVDAALRAASQVPEAGPSAIDTGLRARALLARGEVLRSMGELEAALRDQQAATSLAVSISDAALEGTALAARGRLLSSGGKLDEALVLHHRALEIARKTGDKTLEARALGNIAVIFRFRARIDEALPYAETSLRISEALGHGRLQGDMLSVIATIYQGQQRIDEARAYYERSLQVTRDIGDRGLEASVLGNLGTLHQELGDFEGGLRHTEEALRIFRELGMQRLEGSAYGNIATQLAESGRLEEAREMCRKAVDRLRAAGDTLQEGVFLSHLAGIQATLGYVDDARAAFQAADAILKTIKDDPIAALADLQHGHLDLALAREAEERGDLAEAERHRNSARARVRAAESPTRTHPSDDVRTTLRVLRRAIEGGTFQRRGAKAGHLPADALVVSEDARTFRTPAARAVTLERRRAVRLILLKLVDQRLKAPGEALSADTLLEYGWPGERVLAEAGASRVYVALATLRKLGLRGLLVSRDGGYLLDPSVELVVVPRID